MEIWVVKRTKDTVKVSIMRNKIDGTYSFVNLTKGHVCTCKFNTKEEALADLEHEKKIGKVLEYHTETLDI